MVTVTTLKWWIYVWMHKCYTKDQLSLQIEYIPSKYVDINGTIRDSEYIPTRIVDARLEHVDFYDFLIHENGSRVVDPKFVSSIVKSVGRIKNLTFVSMHMGVGFEYREVASGLLLKWCYRHVTESKVKKLCSRLDDTISDMVFEKR